MTVSSPIPSVAPVTVIEQVPADNVQLPRLVVPSVNATVPAGVLAGVTESATKAFRVVEAVVAMLYGVAVSVVMVASGWMVTVVVPDEVAKSVDEGV